MAAGEGGFSNALNGFNKAEVNEYISKMSKEKQKLEQDLKAKDDSLKVATKLATEAEDKIKTIKEESDKQIAELSAKIKEERKKSDELIIQIDDLKRKLKNSGGKASSGGDPNAEKRAEEIIRSANEKARKIIADAEKKAASMPAKGTAAAPASGATGVDGAAGASGAALMNLLKGFQTMVSGELQKLTAKASDILKTPAPAMTAPAAAAAHAGRTAADDNMDMSNGLFGNMDDDNAANDDMSGFGDLGFGDMNAAQPDNSMDISPLNNEMDMTAEPVTEVAALDDPDIPKAEMDEDFGKDLLEQTVPSSSLNDAMQDIFGAAGGDLEIKGSNDSVDFDMGGNLDFGDLGGSDNSGNSDGGMSDIDAMNALLGQMSANLESSGGSADNAAEDMSASNDDNPWANLQAQLDEMEKSGNFGGEEPGAAPEPDMTAEAPAAPSADDSSIWNFGMPSDSDGSDDDMSDDMSADLFGSF